MDILTFLLLLVAGCAAGFLAGFFGVGGGILLIPVLLFYLPDHADHVARHDASSLRHQPPYHHLRLCLVGIPV